MIEPGADCRTRLAMQKVLPSLTVDINHDRNDRVQITYPHTTLCHRGSGQVVYLERPSQNVESPQ